MEALYVWFAELKDTFIRCFIEDDRWLWLAEGFGKSLLITAFSIILGLVLGIILAAVRSSYDKNEESLKLKGGIGYVFLKFFNGLSKIYITVIRGVPVVVQLMLWYFVFLKTQSNDVLIAVVAFGCNSAAYVAEIFRGGIMSVDNGQFEAGRSLGFNYVQTMIHIIIPQAVKSSLPTLLNEVIALLKETSVAGYVGIMDLTKAGDRIRGITFEAFMPLLAVAAIYLVTVIVLTKIFTSIERRLRRSER
ncbi:MAG: amino acid ABC transporter permease [Clostridia bacterium]|nr:amino acid ABC transporter permease [Clostridia bacterium]